MIWQSTLPTEDVNTKSDNLWIVNLNLESLFTTLTCMNSLGSCLSTFGRYRKGNPKMNLVQFWFLLLTTLHFESIWTFHTLPNAQLVYSTYKNTISISTTRSVRYNRVFDQIHLVTLKNDANTFLHLKLIILLTWWFLQILVFFQTSGYLATLVFLQLLVPLQILQNQHRVW